MYLVCKFNSYLLSTIMPIASNVDFIPVMDEFIFHWNETDPGIKLAEDDEAVTFANFGELRADLDESKTTLQGKLNDWEGARVHLDQLRQSIGDRIAEFNRRIRAEFPNKPDFNRLPDVPNRSAGRDAFLNALDDMINLWGRVNDLPPTPVFTAPLLLREGLTHAQALALRADLDTAFTARGNAEKALGSQRLARDTFQDRARTLMVRYRAKIEALYALDSAEVATLPKVTPSQGSTPDAVELTAEWSPTEQRAELSWTASEDPDLASYQIRYVPGPDYVSADEAPLATIPPGAPLVFQTPAGFPDPGSARSYKVYVRLTTGHEAGSEAKTVFRPA
jgi:hypothetical protein